MEEEKLTVSVRLSGNMREHFLKRTEELGLKRAELIRKLIVEDMEKYRLDNRPIIYYGPEIPIRNGVETTLPSRKPLPSFVMTKKPVEFVSMISANTEVQKIIEETKGNPRLALRKVPENELKEWREKAPLTRKKL